MIGTRVVRGTGTLLPLLLLTAPSLMGSDFRQVNAIRDLGTENSANTRVIERVLMWCVGAEPGVDFSRPPVLAAATPSIIIKELTVFDAGLIGLPRCDVGVRLLDAWYFSVEHYTYWGSGPDWGTALEVEGRSNGGNIRRMTANNVRTGIRISDLTEGTVIDHAQLVNVWDGVVCDTDPGRPLCQIINSHINARHRGIVIRDHPQSYIAGNLIYRYGSSPDFAAIELAGQSFYSTVIGNMIHCGAKTAGTWGIHVTAPYVKIPAGTNTIVACSTSR